MADKINSYKDLRVFQNAVNAAMKVYLLSKKFPPEEKHSMTDQIRCSSRSVCSNITKAMRKRRFKTPFIAKLNDSESAACETQVWVEFARLCNYLDEEVSSELETAYDQIMGQLSKMISQPEKWLFKKQENKQPAESPAS